MPFPCGINLPQDLLDEPNQMPRLRTFAQEAEALGFDSLWTIESVTSKNSVLDPLILLSHIAACTTDIRLGVAIILLTLHNPLSLANNVASLDVVSDGRFDLGLGIGHGQEAMFGYPSEKRLGRFLEMLTVMKSLWTEPKTNHQGERWQLENVSMQPKPVQKPYPPVWIGGKARAVVTRAVKHGDGFVGAGMASSDEFIEQMDWLREDLAAADRDPAGFRVSKRVYLAVTEDKKATRERAAAYFQHHYGRAELVDHIATIGSKQEIIDELNRLAQAGAKHLLLNSMFDDFEQMAILAADIVPQISQG